MSDSLLVERIRRCTHDESISVIAEGLERVICEHCGVVIVRYESMIAGDISRSQFARRADALHEHPRPEEGPASLEGNGHRQPGRHSCSGGRMG